MQEAINVIKGIAITPPLLGRITMGHTEIKGGGDERGIPKKDDHFTITTLVQQANRVWEVHPIQSRLVKGKEKLLRIPVTIAYNDPNLTLHNSYTCFDTQKGRVLCSGNGEKARRITEEGIKQIACPRPEACEYGQKQRCKNMSRAYFKIDGQDDELGVFVLRSTSWNTLTSIAGRLTRLAGLSSGKLAGMPLILELKSKTTAQSFRKPIYYADLTFRNEMSMVDTIKAAREYQKLMADAQLDIEAMENSIRDGIANGDFADEIEDVDEWLSDEDLIAMAGGGGKKTGGLKSFDKMIAEITEKGQVTVAPIAGVGEKVADPEYRTVPQESDIQDLPPLPHTTPSGSPASVLKLAVPGAPAVEPALP